jgi:hypothetical protein
MNIGQGQPLQERSGTTSTEGTQLDAKRHPQLLKSCGPSSSSTSESVRGLKPQDKESCSRSVAATHLGTRKASGFQRFTSSYHAVNDVGIPRPRQEDLG